MYQNESRHGKHRGGVILLVKYSLQKFITNINLTLESQIWLELSCFPNTMFGGVYDPQIALHTTNNQLLEMYMPRQM